ncbi:hypothetical protein H4Q26_000883 [Puccinia striiformis f. sp. tritici PST-130]|nr:hypothetical protein H4Q26_000883 [Puccinia striiformis f. sp. tritici PST-130]
MQIQQLITILCLCLSQALAAPVDMFESQMNAIVVDLTEHRVPKDASGTKLNDALHSDFHEPAAAKNTQNFTTPSILCWKSTRRTHEFLWIFVLHMKILCAITSA